MATEGIEVGSQEYREIMSKAYNEKLLQYNDIIEHHDSFGLGGEKEIAFLAEKLGLTQDSRLLDLCSGIGGSARFLARTYGCKVTGVDISEFFCQTAQKRTNEAGLDHLVDFIYGNALENLLPDQSFTHVFGCDAWSYFPDKVQLFKEASRVLKPGGFISFLEAASDIPGLSVQADEHIGQGYHESTKDYLSMLKAAGFNQIQHHDTTEIACRDIISTIHKQVSRRDKIIASIGLERYFELLDMWAEYLALFSAGEMSHCCFIARKK